MEALAWIQFLYFKFEVKKNAILSHALEQQNTLLKFMHKLKKMKAIAINKLQK